MAVDPNPSIWNDDDSAEITAINYGTGDAGTFEPTSTGTEYHIWNDKAKVLTSSAMTSVRLTIRDADGDESDNITTQHWVEVKSTTIHAGSDGGSISGYTDDSMSVFQPIGKDNTCSIGDIPYDCYRKVLIRVNIPSSALEAAITFKIYVTNQQAQSSINKWVTGLHGNGVVYSTGGSFAVTDSTGVDTVVNIEKGIVLVDDSEIYYGSGQTYTLSTGAGTYKVHVTSAGIISSTTGSVPSNSEYLADTVISSGQVTSVTDKRTYLPGLQSGTTGAMPTNPDLTDVYFATNGKVFLAKTAGSWTMISGGNTFTGLSDTPSSYSGEASKLVKVSTGESALEFTTDFTDYSDGAMIITGGALSTGSSGATFKVGALTSQLRESSGDTDTLKYKTLAEQDNQSITAADTTYKVILTYSTGNPAISLSESSANGKNTISLGKVRKTTGDIVHYSNAGRRLSDGVGKLHKRATSLRELELNGGSAITYAGTNNMGIASGTVYGGINSFTPFSTGAFTSTGSDTFTYVGRASTGADDWFYTTGATAIDYNHYDNQTTGLASITASQYSCHWVYLHPDDEDVYVVYGRNTYKLAEAETAEIPNIPAIIDDFGLLLGKIIAPVAGGSFTAVQMVSDTFFTGTAVATHNDLGGLNDGDNYEHLTQAQKTIATSVATTGANGLLLALDGSTGNYLRGDGSWNTPPESTGAGATTFVGLTDTPADFSGDASKILRVNSSSGAVEFVSSTGLALDSLGTPSTGTTLDSSTGRHGLLIKLTGSTSNYLTADGTWASVPGSTGGEANTASNSNTTGIGVYYQKTGIELEFKGIRAGSSKITTTDTTGTHTISVDVNSTGILLDNLGEAEDNTDLNATTGHHGLLLKQDGDAAHWLDGSGTWTAPTASEVGALYSSGAFTEGAIPEISTTGGVIKASPFVVTTGDVFNFGAHSAGFTEQAIATTTGTIAVNWNSGNKALYTRSTGTAGGAATFTFTAPVKSMHLMLTIVGTTGGCTGAVTLPTAYWGNATYPTFSTGASAIDGVALYYSTGLTKYLGIGSKNFSTI